MSHKTLFFLFLKKELVFFSNENRGHDAHGEALSTQCLKALCNLVIIRREVDFFLDFLFAKSMRFDDFLIDSDGPPYEGRFASLKIKFEVS